MAFQGKVVSVAVSEQTRRIRKQGWYGAKRHVKTALSHPLLHPLMRAVALRVPGMAVRRLPAPMGLIEVRGYADGGEFVMLRPDRCEIAKELYWGAGHRPELRDAFALELVAHLSKDARVLLDVGAYTGVFTLAAAAANPSLRALTFDIVPPVVRMLEANVVRNGLAGRVRVNGFGVGDPHVTMRMPASDRGPALPSFYSQEMDFDEGVDVGFVALDSLVDEVAAQAAGSADGVTDASASADGPAGVAAEELEPGSTEGDDRASDGPAGGTVIMKVDVEGGEADVFGRGQDFLARFRPDVLCEVLPGADASGLEDQLAPHGLHFYAVGAGWLEERAHIVPDEAFRDWFFSARSPENLRARGFDVR